ncbi:MAG: DNA-processing protein DprA [Microbacterium sp.]|nr:DNA-processing protein DprA [Microbacterium sp.]
MVDALHGVWEGSDPAEALARVIWSVVAEPGDGDAGELVARLGARGALNAAFGNRGEDMGREGDGHRLRDARARWQGRLSRDAVLDALRDARHVDARLVLPSGGAWSAAFDDLGPHAPLALWVRGDPGLLAAPPRVAIVGARAASGYGEMLAAEFAGDLAASGAVVVSGGAYGIDGAAHRAALRVGGATVAFLAGGVDRAYPQGHRDLLRGITDTGAVVSEAPCGTAPTKWRFLARNRLIAASSDATVVIEAGWRSGSLNTAGHAAALGRPLGAVPGPVTSATSAGCHRLLREYDARCVTTTGEIRELWGGETRSGGRGGEAEHDRSGPASDPDRIRVLDALGSRSAIDVGEIARRSGLAAERVSAVLGLCELDGVVVRSGGGWRSVTQKAV